ncbi:unnamed protein product, partial [Pleuronectes platessa]
MSSLPFFIRELPTYSGNMRPGIVLHQEEPRAHCTSERSDNRSEDFIPVPNSIQESERSGGQSPGACVYVLSDTHTTLFRKPLQRGGSSEPRVADPCLRRQSDLFTAPPLKRCCSCRPPRDMKRCRPGRLPGSPMPKTATGHSPSTPDLHINCNLTFDSMPKIHPETKALIIKRLKTRSTTEVADTFNMSQRQLQRIRKRFEETGDVFDKPRSGKPRKTTAREDRLLVRKSKASPFSNAAELHQAWSPQVPVSTRTFPKAKQIKVLQDWPAQSPDMNIIEHVWGRMKEEAWKTKPNNLDELWEASSLQKNSTKSHVSRLMSRKRL